MMLIYKGPAPVIVPDARLTVIPGVPTDIPDDLAPGLLARPDWRKAPVKVEPDAKAASTTKKEV